jgi:hypothetical protein
MESLTPFYTKTSSKIFHQPVRFSLEHSTLARCDFKLNTKKKFVKTRTARARTHALAGEHVCTRAPAVQLQKLKKKF